MRGLDSAAKRGWMTQNGRKLHLASWLSGFLVFLLLGLSGFLDIPDLLDSKARVSWLLCFWSLENAFDTHFYIFLGTQEKAELLHCGGPEVARSEVFSIM